ncbi:toxin-antitoxin system HicB family antitoxin [Streptomyces venezuelae]|uniref:Toxin-antitoxin system HicB family antitoxin n=1 Tax=Streptomyces venezuelae TaxID=54571 RepID=A0A5P2B3A3_STRVZ|nr:toxin-antitoxin system HicB family antitoxin [Streptomyces venezuelae]
MAVGAPRLSPGEVTKFVRVNLPESLLDELKELSENESRSLSYLGREAIKTYLYMRRAQRI